MPRAVIIRTYLLFSGVFLAMVFVLVQTGIIIMDDRSEIFLSTTASTKLEQRSAFIEPRRGEILDQHLNPLVTSVSFYDIYMDPVTVSDKVWTQKIGELSVGLANYFRERTAREWEVYLRDARVKGRRYVLIQKKVTNEIRKNLRELPIFELGTFKGGIIDNQVTIVRKRPNGDLLSRTLGYVKETKEDTLLVGIEGAYNEFLAGKQGEILEHRIAQSWKPTGAVLREAINGYDVVTTIDKDIQEVAQTELKHQLERKGGRYGTAIVMEVKTGYIKAIANLQENKDGSYSESYNHAIGSSEVLGSTMKLASLMAALEDGKIKLSDTVNANGNYRFYDQKLTDDKKGGYGKITLQEAFEYSSNVISKVIFDSYKNEPQKYIDRLNQFGITTPTGIRIKGEPNPTFSQPGSESWWGGSLAWMAIGYEFKLTPMEMLAFYNAVANDGKYMQPQLVSQILDNKRVVKEFKPIVKKEKIASQATIDTMKYALEGVMKRGTGRRLKSTFFDIAGKTGTAQIANENKGFGVPGEQKYLASFVGYFPADDPIYSCIVVVAAPTNDIYGASVSGTVFAEIANKVYASSYGYHPAVNENESKKSLPQTLNGNRYDLNTVLNHFDIPKKINGNDEWIRTNSIDDKMVGINDVGVKKGIIPDVRGMGLTDALFLLEQQGMTVDVEGVGNVVQQSILPGTEAVNGGVIKIKLR
ncbi:MAG: penicillin-binding protein [Brumimicrobium sp.]